MSEIDRKHAEPGIADRVGRPIEAEEAAPDGGRIRRYDRGTIVWHPMSGAHEVHGAIEAEYRRAGGPGGALGFPLTDELGVDGHRGGAYQDFMNGQVYWQPELGAHAISGGVYEKFALQAALGGPGYPTGPSSTAADGTVRQEFERATLTWHPEDGAGLIPSGRTSSFFLRVLPICFPDVPPPPGLTPALLAEYFFGSGIDLAMPGGGRVRESVSEYFAKVSGGRVLLDGVVDDWFESDRECYQVAHWVDGDWPEGDPGLDGEFAKAMAHARIRDRASLQVAGRQPDGLYFYHTDLLANGGVTRTMSVIRDGLRERERPELWQPGWDELAGMQFSSSSATLQRAQNIDPRTSRFARRAEPDELVYAPQSTIRHELMHMVGPFAGDIYGAPWRFDATWHEVMSSLIRTDGPIGTSSFARERLNYMAPTTVERRTHLGLGLPELESHHAAVRFPNGPLGDPEFLVLENRRRYDFASPETPRLPNGVFAYAVDPRAREFVQANGGGKRVAGRIIQRSDDWGGAYGTDDGGRRIAEERHGHRTALNHAGEYWWSFSSLTAAPSGAASVDATYRPVDLLLRYDQATWTDHAGAPIRPGVPHGRGGLVSMTSTPPPTALPGIRFRRALALQPPWVPNSAVKGVYAVRVPDHGARLYLSGVFADGAAGSDGVQLSVAFEGPYEPTRSRLPVDLGHVHIGPERPAGTLVVDLNAYAGREVKLAVRVDSLEGSGRDWFYLTEASVVPTARALVDLMTLGAQATFRVGPDERRVALNEDSGHLGAARRDRLVEMQDGRTYAGASLHLHPQWSSVGWIEAEFPVTLPLEYSVLRLLGGFHRARAVVDDGVELSVSFEGGGRTVTLLGNSRVRREPAFGHRGLLRNSLIATAVATPQDIRGNTGTLRIAVNANGNSAQDWFQLVSARFTAA